MSENNGLIPAEAQGGRMSVPQIRALIAGLKDFPEVLKIRDHAQLILHAIGDREDKIGMAQDAAEVKLWAERRVGELLPDVLQHGGDRKSRSRSHDVTLKELGIGKMESSRCQAIAGLDEKVIEEQMAKARTAADVVTSAAVVKLAKTSSRKEKRKRAAAEKAVGADLPPSCRVVHGDALDSLAGLPDGSARLAFADPPYNVGVDYGDGPDADRLPDEQYVAWCRSWFDQVRRVLTDDGTFWLLVGDEYADLLAVELRRAGFRRRAWVKWYETFGVCNSAGSNFSRTSRHLFYCVKDARRYVWNPEAVMRKSDRQTKYADARADAGGKVWDDVWQIPRLTGTSAERIPDFPTQLPLALLLPVVGATSDEGDLVIDPFCGSGTTGAASLTLGRRFLGIEKQPRFARLAEERLKGVPRGDGHQRAAGGAGLGR